jgi:protein-tyrosine phosphatase
MSIELADIHCHILPGIDDGPAGMGETVEMARVYLALGYSHVIATPHVENIFQGREDICALTDRVQDLFLDMGLPLTVLPGAEVLINPDLPRLFQEKALPTLNRTRYVLIEFPIFDPFPEYAEGVFFQLVTQGLIPIIAHPERNRCFQQDGTLLLRLVNHGALLQVDQGSLTGACGQEALEAARQLLRNSVVSFVASNVHKAPFKRSHYQVQREGMLAAWNQVRRLAGRQGLEEIYFSNPEALIKNIPMAVMLEAKDSSLLKRFKNLLP